MGIIHPMTNLDPNVVQQLASDPSVSAWVGASAGTGKTKVLTDRLLRLLLSGTQPERILCLTFTKAAASEMLLRLNEVLEKWAIASDENLTAKLYDLIRRLPTEDEKKLARQLFIKVLECPGTMKIQTIHSFCQSLLGRFPLEANVRPNFQVLEEHDAQELLKQATHQIFRHARQHEDASPVTQAFHALIADISSDDFSDLVQAIVSGRNRLEQIFEHHGGLDAAVEAVYKYFDITPGETSETICYSACRDEAVEVETLRRICQIIRTGLDTDIERAVKIADWLAKDPLERARDIEEYIRIYLTQKDEIKKTLVTKKLNTKYPFIKEALTAEAERLCALQEKMATAEAALSTASFLRLGMAMLDTYEKLKSDRGVMDYDDLILATSKLLSKPDIAPWILFKLDGGLDHILVDEAQDTNPEQWKIIAKLAEEFFSGKGARDFNRTLFVVGDEKQSIFSFQHADVGEFNCMRQFFCKKIAEAEKELREVEMNTSFRSTVAVLEAVDKVFELEEARSGVVFPGHKITHKSARPKHAGRVEIWPTVKPEAAAEDESWPMPISYTMRKEPSARLASVIAAQIQKWLREGEILESVGRPLRPSDIMILVRRKRGCAFMRQVIKALKDKGVPVSATDNSQLLEQLAVQDLLVLAEFLLLPSDDLALATVLKGPFIGLDEDTLFQIAHNRPSTLWESLKHRADIQQEAHIQSIVQWLLKLLNSADMMTPFQLFSSVLSQPCPAGDKSGRYNLVKRLGLDATEAIDDLLSVSLDFEKNHPPSLQGFLQWMQNTHIEAAKSAEINKPGDYGYVRVMTVHSAKGLQAPVVFLADTCTLPPDRERIIWPDIHLKTAKRTIPVYVPKIKSLCEKAQSVRQEARELHMQEYRRLLYVAMTRAADRLYICGWEGKEPRDGTWYKLITKALADFGHEKDFDFTTLGADGWIGKGRSYRTDQLEKPEADKGAVEDAHDLSLPCWLEKPLIEEAPARPLKPSQIDDEDTPIFSPAASSSNRANMLRRGTIIHKLLQYLPQVDTADRQAAASRFLARFSDELPAAEQAEIMDKVFGILENPQFAALFSPQSQAEVPITAVMGERVLSGQIDRLVVSGDEVLIIDYKTNRYPPADVSQVGKAYLNQMAAYREAISRIWPDKRVRSFLLWTNSVELMEIQKSEI